MLLKVDLSYDPHVLILENAILNDHIKDLDRQLQCFEEQRTASSIINDRIIDLMSELSQKMTELFEWQKILEQNNKWCLNK
jgi:hypothetical protein